MARKNSSDFPKWQSPKKEDKFTRISESTRKSGAYRSLSGKQHDLLLLLWKLGNPRSRGKNARLPRNDYPGVDDYLRDEVFYMSINTAVADGLYSSGTRNYYHDMKVLEDRGFIKRISPGRIGKRSIYTLSDKWHDYPFNDTNQCAK
ncbi:hypothetical protein [uncultured Megasphaera sp.]|jgi:hypothetical protein|uniref:hypothetical protein n=1 Tax=uncultured Megasphaera sp. TaxID=165188 RepID=UPI002629DCDB|nr:hypothetical protein [uncultured Megasphaera sp.]